MAAPGPKPRRFRTELEVPSLQSRDSGALYLDEGKEKGNSPSQLGTTTQAPSLEEKPVTMLGKV